MEVNGYGSRDSYSEGDKVIVLAGSLPGTIVRRVVDSRLGLPRYSVRTINGLRIKDILSLKPDLVDNTPE